MGSLQRKEWKGGKYSGSTVKWQDGTAQNTTGSCNTKASSQWQCSNLLDDLHDVLILRVNQVRASSQSRSRGSIAHDKS
jgi:hypothetical protein